MEKSLSGFEEYSDKKKVGLQDELDFLKHKIIRVSRFKRVSLIIGLSLFASGVGIFFIFHFELALSLSLIGIVLSIYSGSVSARLIKTEIQSIENELDLMSIKESSREQRAEKLFKLHQIELKKYYDQTLSHSQWIFWVGLLCIFLGFAIIGITLYFVISTSPLDYVFYSISEKKELPQKIIVSSLGAIGAILSNFIAVLYLKMYSQTIKSLTEFHNRLVITHHLHFGNYLVSRIDNNDKREETLYQYILKLPDIKLSSE